MIRGLGTVINVSTIVTGAGIGVIAGSKFKESTRDLVTSTLGFVTLLAAVDSIKSMWDPKFISSLPTGWTFLVVLAALLVGTLLGLALGIEPFLERFGRALKSRFDRHGESPFIEGFVASSLLFVIGPMAILGSISDGMGSGNQQLVLKSILDGITSIAFAASLGWGVAASAIPVGIYQFAWTGVGAILGSVLPTYQILAMTTTGGILLLGISLRLIRIKEVPVATMLPAIFLAPIFAGLAHHFR